MFPRDIALFVSIRYACISGAQDVCSVTEVRPWRPLDGLQLQAIGSKPRRYARSAVGRLIEAELGRADAETRYAALGLSLKDRVGWGRGYEVVTYFR